jgi:uncharacterized protein (DUF1501 family)
MLAIQLADAPCSRRRFLTLGSLAAGGLSLSSLFSVHGAAEPNGRLDTGKSVIFLFQQGGPSQFETFDPKLDAPVEIRTVGGVSSTTVTGLRFGTTFKRLATLADKLTVVRSFATGNAEHNIRPIVGPESLNANIGSLFARVAGATHPVTAMPTGAVLFPQSVSADAAKGQGRGDLAATGNVGAAFAPFVPGGSGQLQKNLRLNLPAGQFSDRQALLSQLDRLRRVVEPQYDAIDQQQRYAYEVLLSGSVADALDLSREDSKVLAKYDTSHHVADHNWNRARRGARGYYTGHARSLGKALLLARRLCEAGCRFVTVHTGYEGVWDMHADGENLNMIDGMEAIGRSFDHAVAAFIEDVEARGLADKIMLIATGEMGRTPRLNKNGGRDHWAKLTPLMLYGGGVPRGKVIGRSTKDGGEPDLDGFTTPNLISTILHSMLDVGQLRLKPALGAITKLAEATPIG